MTKTNIKDIPKAEIHVHIEGTLTPAMARRIAARNGVTLDKSLFSADGSAYRYENFLDLVTKTYQAVADCMRTKRDYEDVMYDYLKRCAAENCLYVEMIACPGQCVRTGIPYKDMVDGMVAAIDRARAETGIESRINMTFERHRPAEAELDASMILSYPHPYVVGLDIAGGEIEGDLPQFRAAYQRVMIEYPEALGSRVHAGEGAGSRNVMDAIELLNVSRIGHGVRVLEDPQVVSSLIVNDVTLEICPTSNILLMPQYNGDFANYPLRRLYDAGVKITLNSDDPGMFGEDCSIGGEYRIAHKEMGFKPRELLSFTRNAIESSFLDAETAAKLLKRIDAYEKKDFFLNESRKRPRLSGPGMA